MRIEDGRLVIETTTDGRVAADAGDIGGGDGLTSMYRKLSEAELPVTMGKWASEDVLSGLRTIKETNITIAGYLDSNVAAGYLALLGAGQN